MNISNFERLSGDIVLRDMSLVWWAGTTFDPLLNLCVSRVLLDDIPLIFRHS